MIRLNNTPNEGSTVKVNLGFRDSAGQYYIPTKIQYTFLALNNDKESWSIVDDTYLKPLTPASSVVLTIPNVKTITGTTLQRKVMVYWEAFVDNEYNNFTDEITFDIAPKPYVPNEPVTPPPEPPIYVEINSVTLQVGTLNYAPVLPVFILKTNLPVNIDDAEAEIIANDGATFPCNIAVDEAGGTLTINTDLELSYITGYALVVRGLVSRISGYVMKDECVTLFVTARKDTPPYIPVIQETKEFEAVENGHYTVRPDEDYDALRQVEVNVDLPIQHRKDVTITENGEFEIEPDNDKISMEFVVLQVNVPSGGKPVQSKNVTVTENGETTVEADEGKTMNKVFINTEVPIPTIQDNKTVTIDVGDYTEPVEILPDEDTMAKATVTLENIPVVPETQTKEINITENGTTTVDPDTDKVLSRVIINTDVPILPETQTKTVTITENDVTQNVLPDTGKLLEEVVVNVDIPVDETKNVSIDVKNYSTPVIIAPDTGYESMEGAVVTLTNIPEGESKSVTITENGTTTVTPETKDYLSSVEITTAIPLEDNKTETFTTNGEYEITPTTGNTAMKKSTVTVAVPLESGKTETIEHNGTVTISPSTGYDGMEDVEVTVDVPLEANKTETIDLEDYTDPVEITPTTGNDGMQKATVTLTNLVRLYVWKDSNASPNPHYMYTTYSDTSKCDGHAYQCGTVKNALLTRKNVEVNGEALYVSGYASSLYYRDPDNDMTY